MSTDVAQTRTELGDELTGGGGDGQRPQDRRPGRPDQPVDGFRGTAGRRWAEQVGDAPGRVDDRVRRDDPVPK
ncbi:hypothetical protein H4W31_002212 [Plantactinospora soyae]|uniref:Uncharacterized protein n=1 Tax=Plantactinospora soyae TaxID=1544732 RepID=A0A927M2R9_9ACTN|nr:hypothetical protein [Plantactinospora soyae]